MMSSLATTAHHSPMFQRGVQQTGPSANIFTNTAAESDDEEEDGESEDDDEDEDEDDLSAEDQ